MISAVPHNQQAAPQRHLVAKAQVEQETHASPRVSSARDEAYPAARAITRRRGDSATGTTSLSFAERAHHVGHIVVQAGKAVMKPFMIEVCSSALPCASPRIPISMLCTARSPPRPRRCGRQRRKSELARLADRMGQSGDLRLSVFRSRTRSHRPTHPAPARPPPPRSACVRIGEKTSWKRTFPDSRPSCAIHSAARGGR